MPEFGNEKLTDGYIDGPDAWRNKLVEEIEEVLNDHDVRNIKFEKTENRLSEETQIWGASINKAGYGDDNPKETKIVITCKKTGEYEDVNDEEEFNKKTGGTMRP